MDAVDERDEVTLAHAPARAFARPVGAQAVAQPGAGAGPHYAWSGRECLGLLRVRGEALVLHAMRWPDEVRDPASLTPAPVELSDEEIDGALALMDTMTATVWRETGSATPTPRRSPS
ncbi:hypothetical protein [Streptomyces lancefieldiae]